MQRRIGIYRTGVDIEPLIWYQFILLNILFYFVDNFFVIISEHTSFVNQKR